MITVHQRIDPPGGTAVLAGRPVARIGYCAMQLPGPRVSGPPRDRATALAVLRRAIELGVNHVDTAQFCGPDVATSTTPSHSRAAASPFGIGVTTGPKKDAPLTLMIGVPTSSPTR